MLGSTISASLQLATTPKANQKALLPFGHPLQKEGKWIECIFATTVDKQLNTQIPYSCVFLIFLHQLFSSE